MEGQATWLSWAYLFWSRNGRREIPQNRLEELANSAGAEGPVYSSAPLYIQESLVFPYNHGILFMDAVFRKLGRAAFDEVFDHPPVSTQQILHPEAYFASWQPAMTDAPTLDAALGKAEAHQYRDAGRRRAGRVRCLRAAAPVREQSRGRGGGHAIFAAAPTACMRTSATSSRC